MILALLLISLHPRLTRLSTFEYVYIEREIRARTVLYVCTQRETRARTIPVGRGGGGRYTQIHHICRCTSVWRRICYSMLDRVSVGHYQALSNKELDGLRLSSLFVFLSVSTTDIIRDLSAIKGMRATRPYISYGIFSRVRGYALVKILCLTKGSLRRSRTSSALEGAAAFACPLMHCTFIFYLSRHKSGQ